MATARHPSNEWDPTGPERETDTPLGVPGPVAADAAAAPSPPPATRAARAHPALRERLCRSGPDRLRDHEVLALVIGTGQADRSAVAIAHDLVRGAGGLAALAARPFEELVRAPGLGPALASRILAALELGRRVAGEGGDLPFVREPADVVREVRDLRAMRREHLVGLYLDARTRLIARETIAVGSVNVARATPRDVLEPAIRHLASGFVMVHNHPSGLAEPSDDDIVFTRSVARAAAMMGVPLWDHVVVAQAGHASLRARGVQWEGQETSV